MWGKLMMLWAEATLPVLQKMWETEECLEQLEYHTGDEGEQLNGSPQPEIWMQSEDWKYEIYCLENTIITT